MSKFITDPTNDPYLGRHIYMIYGVPGTGKTSAILNLIEQHPDQKVYYLSVDKGLTKLRDMNPAGFEAKYKGKMAWAYINGLRDMREALIELRDVKIKNLMTKVSSDNIWCVIDTVSHLQSQLLAEARKLDVSKGNKKGGKIQDDDEYVRDLLTQVDYNVNLGHMVEITNAMLALPCNVVFLALEKNDTDRYDRKIAVPALSGQSREKICGDTDVIARMVIENGERKFFVQPGDGFYAKDRLGKLDPVEPPDFWALHQKITKKEA
jgi:hypothetical protein